MQYLDLEDRKIQEECGVVGIHQVEDAATLCYYGLHSVQHRGQESAGIASSDGSAISMTKAKGLVTEVFDKQKLERLEPSCQAVGHVRYSSQEDNITENIQPIAVRAHQGDFVIVNNGFIVNAKELRYELEEKGSIFHGTSDTEIISHLIQRAPGTFIEKIKQACSRLVGAFSLIIMTKNTMYAVRDRHGFRPLAFGRLDNGYVFASETCSFEIINADFIRDVEPGEIIKHGKQTEGYESTHFAEAEAPKMCAMEYIYFSRPDSDIDGLNVHAVRKRTGQIIARDDDCEADIVVGVPDSSLSAAMGYAEERGLPYEMGIIKNRYIARTFIKPTQKERDRGVKMKLSPVASIVRDKRVVLLDDSIVRGTTSIRIVQLMREAGAKEVHMRVVSPPLISPCFYGVDMKSVDQLIAANHSIDELCKILNADSLKYLTVEQLHEACGDTICDACFTRDYPTDLYSWSDNI